MPWWKCKSLHDSVSLAHCKNCSWMAPGKWKRAQGIALTYEFPRLIRLSVHGSCRNKSDAWKPTFQPQGSKDLPPVPAPESSQDSGGLYENVLIHPTDAPSDWCLGNFMVRSGVQDQIIHSWIDSAVSQATLSCWRTTAIRACCFLDIVYMVCNCVWVDGACQSDIHMNPRTKGLLAEHCIKTRWTMLITWPVSP